MRESVTYMEILEEGIERGREEGRASEARRLLLLFGEARLGPADASIREALDAIADADTLDRLAERLLTVASWHELLGA
jgi:predicted transposase YdaD